MTRLLFALVVGGTLISLGSQSEAGVACKRLGARCQLSSECCGADKGKAACYNDGSGRNVCTETH